MRLNYIPISKKKRSPYILRETLKYLLMKYDCCDLLQNNTGSGGLDKLMVEKKTGHKF